MGAGGTFAFPIKMLRCQEPVGTSQKNVFFFHSRSCLHACLRQSTTLWAAEESQWLFIRKTTQLNNSLGFLEQRNVLVVLIFGEMASHSMFVIYYHQLRIKAADNYLLWATF